METDSEECGNRLPYSDYQQGNYVSYNGKTVMISYLPAQGKAVIAVDDRQIKTVDTADLLPIALNENVLTKCSPVDYVGGVYIFEFESGLYKIAVHKNNYFEVIIKNKEGSKIVFENIAYSLHCLQTIIMAITRHTISYNHE